MLRRLPPYSPVGIIQEATWPDEWKCLVQCILLNCTSRKQVERIWREFEARFPTPQSLDEAPEDDVRAIVASLGFKDRRTKVLKAMTRAYLGGNWQHASELPGVGVYAARMHDMLFRGELGCEPPKDHALVRVWEWMRNRS